MATQLLLIEDELQLQENIAELLTLNGYIVDTASDGQEGVLHAMMRRPDLIICDVMMPKLNGYQVLELVRTNRSLATVPFIFLTAKAETTDLRQGMNLGADDYLTKPFLMHELLTAIESRLEQEKRRATAVRIQLEEHLKQLGKMSTHEYNTPLTGIMGFAHLLNDFYENFDKAETQSMMALIIASCQRLKRTLDNSLLTSRLLTGEPQPPLSERLTSISTQVVNQILTTIKRQYERTIEDQLEVVSAGLGISEEHLHKILEELIDNALKFSTVTSSLIVIGRQTTTTYRLSITNQGRGLTAEQIASIGPYTQFDRERYEQQGTGLGLFIVKKLAELNEGSVSITSQVDGLTTVTVDLPLAEQD